MSQSVSVREQALRAVVAALSSGDSPADNVFRSRLDRIEQSDLPCFDVTPGDEKVSDPGEYGDRNSITRTLQVVVRAVIDATVQGDAEGEVELVIDDGGLDPFYIFAIQQLTGGSADLGGVVIDVAEVDGKTVFQPAGRDLIGLEMTFELRFATKRGDPTTGA